MSRFTTAISTCLATVLAVLPVRAADPPPQSPDRSSLSLESAIERALAAHPQVLRAEANARAARAAQAGAAAPTSNPTLGVEAGPRIGGTGIEADVGVGLEVPLDLGGTPRHLRRSADAAVRAVDAERRLARLQVVVGVRRAYAEAVAAGRRVELTQQALGVAQQTERVAGRRHELGEVGILEPNSASLQRIAAALALVDAGNAHAGAVAELRTWLAWDSSVPLTLETEVGRPESDREFDTSKLVASAMNARPEVVAAEARSLEAEATLRAARGAGAPGLSLVANWAREGNEANVVTGGFTLELPVQRNQLAVAQAGGGAANAAIDAEALRADVSRQVARTLTRWQLAVERYELAVEAATPLAHENLRLLQRAYETGKEDLLAVLLMQTQALTAQATAIDATVELHRAAAALELAAGEELFQ